MVAGGLFWLWLALNKINLNLEFADVVIYNSLSSLHSGFGHGHLREKRRWA